MKSVPPERIRNVALVGHLGAGKTTLAESLLHCAGVTGRRGRVEDGTTVTDFEPEEAKHNMSLSTALASFEWAGHKINLLDCPGYADVAAEAFAALRVVDLAVFVVSAVDGVQVETELMWQEASRLGLPRMVFINKLDRERSSFTRTLEQLQATFGAGIAPLELPIGEEAAFCGVADLLSDTAITYGDAGPVTGPIPEDMEHQEHAVHEALVEGIVVADDDLMERYLEGDVPSFEELEKTLAGGVAAAQVFPVVCGSAAGEIAVDRLANFLCEIGPSPVDRPPVSVSAGDQRVDIEADSGGQPLVYVWKTVVDPYVGRLSLLKVLSGTLKPDIALTNSRTHTEEKLHSLLTLRGKEQIRADQLVAGDLGAVAKLSDTSTGDTLAPKGTPVVVDPPAIPDAVLSIAIKPKSQGDEDKLMTALHRLQEEDPTLRVRRDDETHQTLLSGMGETHLTVTAERLQRKFGVEVVTEDIIIPYRETITRQAEFEARYKKQTGGHGQFAVVSLRVEPLARGSQFEFADQIVGGVIPKQFIPAVEKGVLEAMQQGGLGGYPVVDVKVTCFDGKHHPVDSSEMSFKMAGGMAFRGAVEQAGPVLLEPISLLRVRVPAAMQGEVMGDLSGRRGRVQGSEQDDDGRSVITALVPTAELTRYAVDLRSMTGGRGSFSVSHSHYDLAPQH